MRVHLLGQPNVQTTAAYHLCPFTQLTIRFARILQTLGIHTTLYASEENDAPCNELVTIITKEEQALAAQGRPYQRVSARMRPNPWDLANARMIHYIRERKQPGDIICSIGGQVQKPVSDAHVDIPTVEFSIGYAGSYAPYRVFKSRAWQHCVYGMERTTTGRPLDVVIQGYTDTPLPVRVSTRRDYLLYVGRLNPRKGLLDAQRVAESAGIQLLVLGWGDTSLVKEPAIFLDPSENTREARDSYMAGARAVICPTQYLEPFNMVAIEAQSYGTPVISTDWGGFTETVEQGMTGFRCHTLNEFVQACQDVKQLDRGYIARRAKRLYTVDAVIPEYRMYFDRLARVLLDSKFVL